MKENRYFAVYLNDGFRFDFNEQCNLVDYTNDKVMVFRHYDKDKNVNRALAYIPYSHIKYVLNAEKDEEGE